MFRSLKRVLTGEVLWKIDVVTNESGVFSFRLKREKRTAEPYVVLALKSPGNRQYYAFDENEFETIVDAAIEARDALRAESRAK
jgi:hypothetical protein